LPWFWLGLAALAAGFLLLGGHFYPLPPPPERPRLVVVEESPSPTTPADPGPVATVRRHRVRGVPLALRLERVKAWLLASGLLLDEPDRWETVADPVLPGRHYVHLIWSTKLWGPKAMTWKVSDQGEVVAEQGMAMRLQALEDTRSAAAAMFLLGLEPQTSLAATPPSAASLPSPAPAPPPLPVEDLELLGLVHSGSTRSALIRRADTFLTVQAGDAVGPYRVRRVGESMVLLVGPQGPLELGLTSQAARTSVRRRPPSVATGTPAPALTPSGLPEPKIVYQGGSLTWVFSHFAVGLEARDPGRETDMPMQPDIVALPDGRYRMYYAVAIGPRPAAGPRTGIKSALSSDGLTWEVEPGYRLQGDGDGNGGPDGIPAHEQVVTGPRVVRLGNGTYRMYYNSASHGQDPPNFRVKSAISPDGLNWTREGTVIDINPSGKPDTFSLAGHCAVIRFNDNHYVMFLSGNVGRRGGPSDLYLGTSSDGLRFTGFRVLYENGHDPYVLPLRDGRYLLLYGDLLSSQRVALSPDGRSWPRAADTWATDQVNEEGVVVTEDSPEAPGDRAALQLPSGEILLYTNWGNPSQNIALLRQVSSR
jgi:hypothetical protein